MSKLTMEFSLPEDRDEMEHAIHGGDYHAALFEIGQKVFRPARKHGYSDQRLQALIEKLDATVEQLGKDQLSDDWPTDEYGPMNATDLIALLEKQFHQILDENGVQL